MNFIDGTGYTVLSNTVEWLLHHDVLLRFTNFNNLARPAIGYLDDCGFFFKYAGEALRSEASCRSSTMPCVAVQHAHSFSWLERDFSPWLGGELRKSHGELGSIRTCVKELFHNINDHSAQSTGFVHAQHYPTKREIRITVSDFGRGIPTTIREKFGDMADHAAILHASHEGVTAKTKPNNMGAGLNYLIDTVSANRGLVSIYSLSGSLHTFCGKGGEPVRRAHAGNGNYPGTLVDIALDTRLFVGDEEERVEIEW
ncbi:hypothetical protein ASD39_13990 [Sphingomonas sp. Root50]|nr:hypothetical protein ASD17_10795 [Sphingomonas sp. Root1294]KQY65253.1 hypothetical protein ASD39_13990 [Sphingomonas sp. Root50]KRB95453.1 hypothetical protein ASE22_06065 [Sphingomonas sp. Root720]